MLKILNPKLAKIVGEKASIVFQHLCYWMQTQKVSTVYRTNKELVSDLEDMFSEQQIQRSKKKLIDAGMITVSFDKKNVWNRTTHYTLTEKGKEYVLSLSLETKENTTKTSTVRKTSSEAHNVVSKENTCKRTNNFSKAPQRAVREQNGYVSSDHPTNNSKAMKESFNEGFTNKNAVKCPDNLLSLIKKKSEVYEETQPIVESSAYKSYGVNTDDKQEDNSWEDIVKAEQEMLFGDDEYVSDEDYKSCGIAILKSFDKPTEDLNHKVSLSDLMKKCFDRGFTDDQEKLYSMKMNQQHFVEDY